MATLIKPLFKVLGIILALFGVFILLWQLILNPDYTDMEYNIIVSSNAHFIIIFGLMMLTFSKEKIDDERVQLLRYFTTKLSLRLLILIIPAYIILTNLERVTFSVQPIFFIIEGVIVFYQILFRVGLKNNPKFMFNDRTGQDIWFIITFLCFVTLGVVTIIDAVGNIK